MQNKSMIVGALMLSALGCEKKPSSQAATPGAVTSAAIMVASTLDPTPVVATNKKLFLDVHELGPGKVTAQAAASAHQKDLAIEGKYGVHFQAYWLDEKAGKIYCLAEAPSAESLNAVHKEAHGLLADKIEEVSQGR